MFDVITFGSATCDIFLPFQKRGSDGESGKICFGLGDKIEAGDWTIHSGGGGANAACTFARQGLKTAYCGKVGNDYFGELVLRDLEKDNARAEMVIKDRNKNTALSLVLSPQGADRAIIVSPGACHFLTQEDINWNKIKRSRWFYIAPFYKKSADVLPRLVEFAQENKIKVALNPSESQIKERREEMKNILANVSVLLLNLKEAFLLAGLPESNERFLAEKIKALGPDIVVITKGKAGAIIFDGESYYEAAIAPVEVKERTGAGDAFGSGFVAGLLQKDDIKYAIRLAMANSAGCLKQVGAKNGLLKKGELDSWPTLDIKQS